MSLVALDPGQLPFHPPIVTHGVLEHCPDAEHRLRHALREGDAARYVTARPSEQQLTPRDETLDRVVAGGVDVIAKARN
jgi:hypothetical protein